MYSDTSLDREGNERVFLSLDCSREWGIDLDTVILPVSSRATGSKAITTSEGEGGDSDGDDGCWLGGAAARPGTLGSFEMNDSVMCVTNEVVFCEQFWHEK